MSIHDLAEKIKALRHREDITDIYSIIIIVLVAISAFGLGRLSKTDSSAPLVITVSQEMATGSVNPVNIDQTANTPIYASTPAGKAFLASKNGKNYYSVNCSGAKRIKDSNKVWFATEAEAESAGFTKSATCKDL